jgi:hypothetical protein
MAGAIDHKGVGAVGSGAAAAAAKPGAVLLADTSFSMNTRDTLGGLRRIDHLAQVLGYLLSRVRLQALICFNTSAQEIALGGTQIKLPEPDGGTALELPLMMAAEIRPKPTKVIVLCDGEVNNQVAALAAARALRPIPIDAYYCGPDGPDSRAALEFMRRLSEAGGEGGQSGKFKLGDHTQIGEALRLRIAGPRRG